MTDFNDTKLYKKKLSIDFIRKNKNKLIWFRNYTPTLNVYNWLYSIPKSSKSDKRDYNNKTNKDMMDWIKKMPKYKNPHFNNGIKELSININKYHTVIDMEVPKFIKKFITKYYTPTVFYKPKGDDIMGNLNKYKLNTPEFIKEFKNKLTKKDWIDITPYLSDFRIIKKNTKIKIINEIKNLVDWKYISGNLKDLFLNDIDFIREFKDYIDWFFIKYDLRYNSLKYGFNNKKFKDEFKDYLK